MSTTTTVTYSTKYQPACIISDIIKSEKNTHLHKDRCGSGATHSIFQLDEKILLLAPTVALVKGKEEQCKQGEFSARGCEFFYGTKSIANKFPTIGDSRHIIMGTVDKLINLAGHGFAAAGYTLVIDELHTDVMGSTFRETLRDCTFGNLVSEFTTLGRCITVTATPLKILPQVFQGFDILDVKSTNPCPLRTVHYTHDNDIFSGAIKEAIQGAKEGQPVAIFSNDVGWLTKAAKLAKGTDILKNTYKVVGQTIDIKLCPQEYINGGEAGLVYLCSSAATEGIDIKNQEITLLIHTKLSSDWAYYSSQQLIQSLGRARKGFSKALIYLDPKESYHKEPNEEREVGDIEKVAKANTIKDMTITGDITNLTAALLNHRYTLIPAGDDMLSGTLPSTGITLVKAINNLLELDTELFDIYFFNVCRNAHISARWYGFSPNLVFSFLCTKIVKELSIPIECVNMCASARGEFFQEVRSFRAMLIYADLHIPGHPEDIQLQNVSEASIALKYLLDYPNVDAERSGVLSRGGDGECSHSSLRVLAQFPVPPLCINRQNLPIINNLLKDRHGMLPKVLKNLGEFRVGPPIDATDFVSRINQPTDQPEQPLTDFEVYSIVDEMWSRTTSGGHSARRLRNHIRKLLGAEQPTNILKASAINERLNQLFMDGEISRNMSLLYKFEFFYSTRYPSDSVVTRAKKYIASEPEMSTESIAAYVDTKWLKVSKAKTKLDNKATLKDKEVIKRVELQNELIGLVGLRGMLAQSGKRINQAEITAVLSPEDVETLITGIYKGMTKHVRMCGALYVRDFESGIILKDCREYSALTSVNLEVFGIHTPYGTLDTDMTSAVPTFINAITGATIDVYATLISRTGNSRYQVKQTYNMYVNSTTENIPDVERMRFFIADCGYTPDQAMKICGISTGKGDAFRLFSRLEQSVMANLAVAVEQAYGFTPIRRHDSIVCFPDYAFYRDNKGKFSPKEINLVVTEEVDGVRYTINPKFHSKYIT